MTVRPQPKPATSATSWNSRVIILVVAVSASLAVAATIALAHGGPSPVAPATTDGRESHAGPAVDDTEPGRPLDPDRDDHAGEGGLSPRRRGLADETTFRVGTFNVLGSYHTAKGGNRKGWDVRPARMAWPTRSSRTPRPTSSASRSSSRRSTAASRAHPRGTPWPTYPEPTTRPHPANSIAWRTDVWTLVEADATGPLLRRRHAAGRRRSSCRTTQSGRRCGSSTPTTPPTPAATRAVA